MAHKKLNLNEKKGLWANIHAKRKRGEKMNPKGHPDAPTSKEMKMAQEAIQRRMDRMVIIATDPATGRKVVKIAPKKEIDIGKGKQESFDYDEGTLDLIEQLSPFITEDHIPLLDSLSVEEIPVIILLLIIFFLFVINVPDLFINDDLTSIFILFNLASCIESGCITFDPNEAISNISS